MKSAMQELIEKIKEMPAFNYEPVIHGIFNIATELLEKEKQQIIDAFDAGSSFQFNSWKYSIIELDKQREDYYNKTFTK